MMIIVLFSFWCALVSGQQLSNDFIAVVKDLQIEISKQKANIEKMRTVIENNEASNDLGSTVKTLQIEMASLKGTLAKQNGIIQKQSVDIGKLYKHEAKLNDIIEKMRADTGNLHKNEARLNGIVALQNGRIAQQKGIIEKMGTDIKTIKNSEQTLKVEITNLHNDLKKMKKPADSCCLRIIGRFKEIPAISCKWLRENSRNVESGLFWISLKNPTKIYCDMNKENDGGGWTMIGQAQSQKDSEGDQIDYRKIMSNNAENLSIVETKRFLLSAKGLRELQKHIKFTQIRFYCHKPWHGRTLHIYTPKNDLGAGVVDLMTGKSDMRPKSCGSFVRMNDDSSTIGTHCESWFDQKWWDYGDAQGRMYDLPMVIGGRNHFMLFGDYILCDDYLYQPGFNKIGRWAFYVR